MAPPRAIDASVDVYVSVITQAWRKIASDILEVGECLVRAKADLAPAAFDEMVAKLPFGPSTARRLMLIAENRVLSDRAHVHTLPPSWGTLYELSKLPEPVLEQALVDGRITPRTERKDAIALRPSIKAKAAEVEVAPPEGNAATIKRDSPLGGGFVSLVAADDLGVAIALQRVEAAARELVIDLIDENKPLWKMLTHEPVFLAMVNAFKALDLEREKRAKAGEPAVARTTSKERLHRLLRVGADLQLLTGLAPEARAIDLVLRRELPLIEALTDAPKAKAS